MTAGSDTRWKPAFFDAGDVLAERRVKLTLPGSADAEDAMAAAELPFVVLLLGNFSGRSDDPEGDIHGRQEFALKEKRIGSLMRLIKPHLSFNVEADIGNGPQMCAISFAPMSMDDFEIEQLADAVEAFHPLLTARAVTESLRQMIEMPDDTREAAAAPDLAAEIMSVVQETARPGDTAWYDQVDAIAGTVAVRIGEKIQAAPTMVANALSLHVVELDRAISRLADAIVAHPQFVDLERTWRGFSFLVRSLPRDRLILFKVLDLSREEFVSDLVDEDHGAGIEPTALYRLLVDQSFDQFGAPPVSLILADFELSGSDRDMLSLRRLAEIAEACYAPALSAATPDMLHLGSFRDLGLGSIDLADGIEGDAALKKRWDRLRAPARGSGTAQKEIIADPARFLCLALPRLRGRPPLACRTERAAPFTYLPRPGVGQPLWINAAYAVAQVILRSFHLYRWASALSGFENGSGVIAMTPTQALSTGESLALSRAPLDVSLSAEKARYCVDELGLTPLLAVQGRGLAVLHDSVTLKQPTHLSRNQQADASAVLQGQLVTVLAVSRIAHYLKVMTREQIGASRSETEIESFANRWLSDYTTRQEAVTPRIRAERPLRDGRVRVRALENEPGKYAMQLRLVPHSSVRGIICQFDVEGTVRAG